MLKENQFLKITFLNKWAMYV